MKNRENNIEQLLKKHLGGKMSRMDSLPLEDCPSELELNDYLEDRLSQQQEESVLEHIASCSRCLSLLELAQRAKERKQDKPTAKMIKRAQNIMPNKSKKTIFNYRWQVLAAISFTLSFILPRYFLQFLILAVIFSIKWIFDTGSTRSLIMIYEAWRKKDKGTTQRIIQDFQDKIERRG